MLEAFKAKPYDLAAVYASWPNPPIFQGNPDEDPLIWLAAIKAGCVERKVPKEHWHRVAKGGSREDACAERDNLRRDESFGGIRR